VDQRLAVQIINRANPHDVLEPLSRQKTRPKQRGRPRTAHQADAIIALRGTNG
jgi:hypothetical protein